MSDYKLGFVTEVKSFKCSDGEEFSTLENAKRHQAEVNFGEWYWDKNNTLYGSVAGCVIELREMKAWLRQNAYMIRHFLGASCDD